MAKALSLFLLVVCLLCVVLVDLFPWHLRRQVLLLPALSRLALFPGLLQNEWIRQDVLSRSWICGISALLWDERPTQHLLGCSRLQDLIEIKSVALRSNNWLTVQVIVLIQISGICGREFEAWLFVAVHVGKRVTDQGRIV